MVIFSILLVIALLLMAITFAGIAVGGTAFVIVFGDVIVCIFIILWLMKRLTKRKKK